MLMRRKGGECRRVEREGTSALTYGAPYGRGVEMGRLRLRHRADGAQGVVQLGGGGNSVPGESAVFVVTAAAASSSTGARSTATIAAVTIATSAATTAGSSAVRAAGRTTASATELAQELVLVLDAPFTRPQLQQTGGTVKSKFASWRGTSENKRQD